MKRERDEFVFCCSNPLSSNWSSSSKKEDFLTFSMSNGDDHARQEPRRKGPEMDGPYVIYSSVTLQKEGRK